MSQPEDEPMKDQDDHSEQKSKRFTRHHYKQHYPMAPQNMKNHQAMESNSIEADQEQNREQMRETRTNHHG